MRGELKTNRTYGLSVSDFCFYAPPHWGDNRILPYLALALLPLVMPSQPNSGSSGLAQCGLKPFPDCVWSFLGIWFLSEKRR